MSNQYLLTAEHKTVGLNVGIITLHRPAQRNALNDELLDELSEALLAYDADDRVGCVILTGGDSVFAAGADVNGMVSFDFATAFKSRLITRNWEALCSIRKPVIAAVAGLALGGGCELALMCAFIIAAETAKFGQPEARLGIIPGAGGTQRLPRSVGKSKALDMLLTGRPMTAEEAKRAGLVARVVPASELMNEALGAATAICKMSQPSVQVIRECVDVAFETPLAEGIRFERRMFHALFSTRDQKEGMSAFLEKRPPVFKHS